MWTRSLLKTTGNESLDVVNRDIDVFVMGDDWEGKFDFLKEHCEVVYLPRTIGISTSKIKNDLFTVNNG